MKRSSVSSRVLLIVLSCALGLGAACTDEPIAEPIDEGSSEEPVPDDTVFFETVVELQADGRVAVSEPRAITAGEQRAQNELRRAVEAGELAPPVAGIAEDGSCRIDSVWLYSRTDWTGSRICFRGLGPAFLEEYGRYVMIGQYPVWIGDWRISSGSYWPGVDRGFMRNQYYPVDPSTLWEVVWPAWGSRAVLNQPTKAYVLALY